MQYLKDSSLRHNFTPVGKTSKLSSWTYRTRLHFLASSQFVRCDDEVKACCDYRNTAVTSIGLITYLHLQLQKCLEQGWTEHQ